MSSLLKFGVVAMFILGVFGVWKYVSAPPEPIGSDGVLLTLTDKDWVKGNVDAPVTLIEYTDFQCPACGAYYPILDQLSKDFDGKLKFVVRHFPLIQIHKQALTGARAVEAAGRQGKFWEMYDLLYINQAEWSGADDPTKSILPSYAGRIGISIEQFREDMKDTSLDDKINADRETGNTLKVNGTPSFFLNGEKISNPKDATTFKTLIEEAIKKTPVKTNGAQ